LLFARTGTVRKTVSNKRAGQRERQLPGRQRHRPGVPHVRFGFALGAQRAEQLRPGGLFVGAAADAAAVGHEGVDAHGPLLPPPWRSSTSRVARGAWL
jgi:hypothetical protein